ncbi:MAG: preprotein translocase subunit SecE [Alphaproteobacteria bacterium]|nr:preprotein translocase subunit SecE [Alphaproteobacteria bacterium]
MAERTSPLEFLRQVRQEAAKVTWPARRELAVSTVMVFVLVFIAAIFFFAVDSVLVLAIQFVIGLGT